MLKGSLWRQREKTEMEMLGTAGHWCKMFGADSCVTNICSCHFQCEHGVWKPSPPDNAPTVPENVQDFQNDNFKNLPTKSPDKNIKCL